MEKQKDVNFAYSLSESPFKNSYLQAEYVRLQNKYSFQKYEELPICVVSVGRNLGSGYLKMIHSVLLQNYSNYKMIIIDDNSDDGTKEKTQEFLNKHSNLQGRIRFIQQSERKHALFNRNLAIKEGCSSDDIVLDVDSDDWLLGRQVFKVVNALYQNTNNWAIYFNNIIYSKDSHCPLMNSDSKVSNEML